ncbi:MAG: SMC family ATPase [Fibromonadales bacterium]|nr:SMC family ATPase [Fibromonadales bacterium]
MKPLKLTMSAFGSYASLETIDFTALGAKGLYIIAGETGSGKTTIFDAISFALFGESSGTARDKSQMLCSHFAEEKAKTFVELDFSSGCKKYKIKRIIKKNGSQEAELTLPDGNVASGDRNVKNKITEIIGLSREQFAQIVMIAQNDFLRFLHSDTKERLEILRRIFNTNFYKKLQDKLKLKEKDLSDQRKLCIKNFERLEADHNKSKETQEAWKTQIKEDKLALSEIEKKLQELEKEEKSLVAEIAMAKDLMGKFESLAKTKLSFEEHAKQAAAIEALGKRRCQGELALRKVKPFADKVLDLIQQHKKRQAELSKARIDAETAGRNLENIKQKIPIAQAENPQLYSKLKRLEELQRNFEKFCEEFKIADSQYKSMYEAFLRGQAGLLAKNLVAGEPCPVCGSCQHPEPAKLCGEQVNEAKLKETENKANNIRKKCEELSTACSTLKTEIETEAQSRHKLTLALVGKCESEESNALNLLNNAKDEYKNALADGGFADGAAYKSALVEEKELGEMAKRLNDYENEGKHLNNEIKRLEGETESKEKPDWERLKAQEAAMGKDILALRKKRDEIKIHLGKIADALKELCAITEELGKIDMQYSSVKQLSDVANGKLNFETYVQTAYFNRVLCTANQRLKVMSQNRYEFFHAKESSDGRSSHGLEIEVLDSYTGKQRHVKSLSGGESFMASLSLSLGLSDVVQQSAGGIHLDAMFIDEGFGSLDAGVLDLAMKTLSDMAGSERIIGIISHVSELCERIDKQIRVEKTNYGSKIHLVV